MREMTPGGLYPELPYGAIGCTRRSYGGLAVSLVPWHSAGYPETGGEPVQTDLATSLMEAAMTVTFYGFAVSGRVIREALQKEFPTPDWGASAPTRGPRREDVGAVHRVRLEKPRTGGF